MPKESLVTAETVFQAADHLQQQGRHPSLRAVREAIGGGSFGDIVPLLQIWRKQRAASSGGASITTRPLSPRLVSALDQLATISAEISDAVSDEVQQVAPRESMPNTQMRAELSQLQQLAKDQMNRLRQERDHLQQQNETLSEQLLAHKQEIISQQEEIDILAQELTDLKEWREKLMPFLKQLSQ